MLFLVEIILCCAPIVVCVVMAKYELWHYPTNPSAVAAVEEQVAMIVPEAGLTAAPPLPAVLALHPQEGQAGMEQMHQSHHAKIDTQEEREHHQPEVGNCGIRKLSVIVVWMYSSPLKS